MNENALSNTIIGAAIEVHRQLGPGLLESVYEECLAYELLQLKIAFERQKPIPVIYKNVKLDCGFRLDLLISNLVIVELKAVEILLPVHTTQILTYLRLTNRRLALLMNFNVPRLELGIKRFVNNL